jgi:hypothetical protein
VLVGTYGSGDGNSGGFLVCYGGSSFLLRLGGGVSRWSTVALASVSVVCRVRGEKSDPQVSFLAFSCSFHCFGPCLNMRYTRNILALEI